MLQVWPSNVMGPNAWECEYVREVDFTVDIFKKVSLQKSLTSNFVRVLIILSWNVHYDFQDNIKFRENFSEKLNIFFNMAVPYSLSYPLICLTACLGHHPLQNISPTTHKRNKNTYMYMVIIGSPLPPPLPHVQICETPFEPRPNLKGTSAPGFQPFPIFILSSSIPSHSLANTTGWTWYCII